jgi:hypothetical protein
LTGRIKNANIYNCALPQCSRKRAKKALDEGKKK